LKRILFLILVNISLINNSYASQESDGVAANITRGFLDSEIEGFIKFYTPQLTEFEKRTEDTLADDFITLLTILDEHKKGNCKLYIQSEDIKIHDKLLNCEVTFKFEGLKDEVIPFNSVVDSKVAFTELFQRHQLNRQNLVPLFKSLMISIFMEMALYKRYADIKGRTTPFEHFDEVGLLSFRDEIGALTEIATVELRDFMAAYVRKKHTVYSQWLKRCEFSNVRPAVANPLVHVALEYDVDKIGEYVQMTRRHQLFRDSSYISRMGELRPAFKDEYSGHLLKFFEFLRDHSCGEHPSCEIEMKALEKAIADGKKIVKKTSTRTTLSTTKARLKKAATDLEEKKVAEAKAATEKVKEPKDNTVALKEEIKQLQKKLDESTASAKTERTQLQARIKKLENKASGLQSQLDKQGAALTKVKTEKDELSRQLAEQPQAEAEEDVEDERLTEALDQVSELQQEIDELESAKEELERLNRQLTEAEQAGSVALGELKKQVQKLEDENKGLFKEARKLAGESKQLSEQLTSRDRKLKEAQDKLREQQTSHGKEIADIQARLDQLAVSTKLTSSGSTTKIKLQGDAIARLEAEKEGLKKQLEIASTTKTKAQEEAIAKLEAEIVDLKKQVSQKSDGSTSELQSAVRKGNMIAALLNEQIKTLQGQLVEQRLHLDEMSAELHGVRTDPARHLGGQLNYGDADDPRFYSWQDIHALMHILAARKILTPEQLRDNLK
jgi:hypothetical protein